MNAGRRVLLDTHVLLWALVDPNRLVPAARKLIEDGANEVFVSAASAWEIEIKRALGKLEVPGDLAAQCRAARFAELPVRIDHAVALRTLPPLHHDPFDRLLIAQARVEKMQLITRDNKFSGYEVEILPG